MGVARHIVGLFKDPKEQWKTIREEECSVTGCYTRHTLFLAAIPALSGLIGTTVFGWQVGGREPIRLTFESGLVIAILYYLAMLVGVYSLGAMIRWMGTTYGSEQPLSRTVMLAAYTATPLFLIGVFELYPILWLNLVVGLPALAYTVYLLYTGVPVMMEVTEERGFLFSSAVLAVGLVALVALLAATAFLWGIGVGPAFTA